MGRSIPQRKEPSLLYGLGVASPFMKDDAKAALLSIPINPSIIDIQQYGIVENIALESYILNNLEYDRITIGSDAELSLGSKGLIIDAKGTSTIKIHVKHTDSSKKMLGILPSAIIIRCHENVNTSLIIVQDDHEQEIAGKTAFFLKGIVMENASLTINDLIITQHDSYRKSRILLQGKESKVYPIHGLFSYGNAQIDMESDVDHEGEGSESDMKIRAIVSGSSSAIVQGDVTIKPSAYGSNGYQTEDIMLIGKNAIARPIPNLEIGNHDVKCSHGATVANVDDETLFYAMSRGIRRDDALAMLISSFLSPVLKSFPRELLTIYEERISSIITDTRVLEDS
jgi:Fe-S cluster assembly scaffold protein SufB